jgi:hypothetical protein
MSLETTVLPFAVSVGFTGRIRAKQEIPTARRDRFYQCERTILEWLHQ